MQLNADRCEESLAIYWTGACGCKLIHCYPYYLDFRHASLDRICQQSLHTHFISIYVPIELKLGALERYWRYLVIITVGKMTDVSNLGVGLILTGAYESLQMNMV